MRSGGPSDEDERTLTRLLSAPAGAPGAQFRAAWSSRHNANFDMELLPARLARAAADMLGVDDAGLSVLDDYFRVPVGASSESASHAERLEFTTGEGPCLEAASSRRPAGGTVGQMQHRWPTFAAQLADQTPYRAVMSFPVGPAEDPLGAIDLYLRNPDRLALIDEAAARGVTEEIYETLVVAAIPPAPGPLSGRPEPRWMHGNLAQSRMAVWIAVGELMVAFDTSAPDALALLRARAFAESATVDDVAHQLIDGDLEAEAFTP